MGAAKPFVPVERLTQILDEYMDWYGLDRTSLAREIASGSMLSEDAWFRRLYAWYNGESSYVRFSTVDAVLCALGWMDRWHSDLADIYELAA